MCPGERSTRSRRLNGFTTRKQLFKKLKGLDSHITYRRLGALERCEVDPTFREINILCDMLDMSADYFLRDDFAPKEAIFRKIDKMSPAGRKLVLCSIDAVYHQEPSH